jgi:hypothetical protein
MEQERAEIKKDSGFPFLKLGAFSLAAIYFLFFATNAKQWNFFDGVDLIIHEAGHVFFMPFGQMIYMAGGSIMQLLVPLIFVIYFARRREWMSCSVVSFWLGQSFINLSVYISDAIDMALPLLGGGIHDWNFLLGELGLTPLAPVFGGVCYFIGVSVMIAAATLGLFAIVYGKNSR